MSEKQPESVLHYCPECGDLCDCNATDCICCEGVVLSCCGDDITNLDIPICPTCKEWQ